MLLCESCGHEYTTERGLRQHQTSCEEFLCDDNAANAVENALERYLLKKARTKHKAKAHVTISEPTDSNVCSSYFKFARIVFNASQRLII